MKKYTSILLLTAAPLFAGVSEPIAAPAPQANCEQGWTLGLEALALRPYGSAESYDESNYDFGGRVSLGYQFSSCLFAKITYFGYSTDTLDDSYQTSYGEGYYGYGDEEADMDAQYVDAVVGGNFKPSETLSFSPYVGIRWGSFEQSYSDSWVNEYYDETGKNNWDGDFEGFGLVVGFDTTWALGNNFSLYGTAKQSVLFGSADESWKDSYIGEGSSYNKGSSSETVTVAISELGLGVQYDFSLGSVASNVRAGFEGQYWAGAEAWEQNTILAGFVLGANFRF
jgi:hypothetical protein